MMFSWAFTHENIIFSVGVGVFDKWLTHWESHALPADQVQVQVEDGLP